MACLCLLDAWHLNAHPQPCLMQPIPSTPLLGCTDSTSILKALMPCLPPAHAADADEQSVLSESARAELRKAEEHFTQETGQDALGFMHLLNTPAEAGPMDQQGQDGEFGSQASSRDAGNIAQAVMQADAAEQQRQSQDDSSAQQEEVMSPAADTEQRSSSEDKRQLALDIMQSSAARAEPASSVISDGSKHAQSSSDDAGPAAARGSGKPAVVVNGAAAAAAAGDDAAFLRALNNPPAGKKA